MAFCDLDTFKPKNAYVFWVDIMGTRSIMSIAPVKGTYFMMRMHLGLLEIIDNHPYVHCFPMNDGVFFVCERRNLMLNFINEFMLSLFQLATLRDNPRNPVAKPDMEKSFLVKGALSYGPLYYKDGIVHCNAMLRYKQAYTDRIISGMPMIQAYECEKFAPPFGIYIHESVRAFHHEDDVPLAYVFWRWWLQYENCDTIRNEVKEYVEFYLNNCKEFPDAYLFPIASVETNLQKAKAYFR